MNFSYSTTNPVIFGISMIMPNIVNACISILIYNMLTGKKNLK